MAMDDVGTGLRARFARWRTRRATSAASGVSDEDPRDADRKLESWLTVIIMVVSLVMVLWNM